MFSRKRGYLKIEKICYKALKIIYNNNESYDELLAPSNKYQFIKSTYALWPQKY